MERITYITIAGKEYPLNFSTKAAKELSARYGGLENITDAFRGEVEKTLEAVIFMLALLIDQGVKYKKLVDGEDVPGISEEGLEIVLGLSDFGEIKSQLLSAMTAGMSSTVEVDNSKNDPATQEE